MALVALSDLFVHCTEEAKLGKFQRVNGVKLLPRAPWTVSGRYMYVLISPVFFLSNFFSL